MDTTDIELIDAFIPRDISLASHRRISISSSQHIHKLSFEYLPSVFRIQVSALLDVRHPPGLAILPGATLRDAVSEVTARTTQVLTFT